MTLLVLGLIAFIGLHFIPVFAPTLRGSIISKIGMTPWKAGFAIMVATSVVLIVLGWQATIPTPVYEPPAFAHMLALGLMPFALILFISGRAPTNLKRVIRHPQLSGVVFWAIIHLIANGDDRSLLLFGGIGLWALVSIFGINKRDGEWVKPEPKPKSRDIVTALIGLTLYCVFYFLHGTLFGVAV